MNKLERMNAKAIPISAFASNQLNLLAAEQAAETSQTATLLSTSSPSNLASAGLAVTNLLLSNQRTGLGGRTVLELEHDSALSGKDGVEVEHGLRVGDIVRVGEQPKGAERKKEKAKLEAGGAEGVIIKVKSKGLDVAIDEGKKGEDGLEALGAGRLWV